MRVLPYRTTNNVIAGVVLSFQDITGLKKTESALRLGEQRYKSLFDHCPIAILEVDSSALVNYITQHKLSTVAKLKKHWPEKGNTKQMVGLITPLNINEAGQILFCSNSKKELLKMIPTLMNNDEGGWYQKMKQVIEKQEVIICESQVATIEGKQIMCNITITIPRVDNELNFANTVIVLVPQ
jgi:two-component system CheB/CheR fusion protein